MSLPSSQVLSAAEYDSNAEVRSYANQVVDTGEKARVYADDFIGVHLANMRPYSTYAAGSGASRANPGDTNLQQLTQTLFTGTMLRATLLNAYGWCSCHP
jgi:hypothetical protein